LCVACATCHHETFCFVKYQQLIYCAVLQFACMYVCMYVCLHVCMYVHTCMHLHHITLHYIKHNIKRYLCNPSNSRMSTSSCIHRHTNKHVVMICALRCIDWQNTPSKRLNSPPTASAAIECLFQQVSPRIPASSPTIHTYRRVPKFWIQ
jgi:hypothetical protein